MREARRKQITFLREAQRKNLTFLREGAGKTCQTRAPTSQHNITRAKKFVYLKLGFEECEKVRVPKTGLRNVIATQEPSAPKAQKYFFPKTESRNGDRCFM